MLIYDYQDYGARSIKKSLKHGDTFSTICNLSRSTAYIKSVFSQLFSTFTSTFLDINAFTIPKYTYMTNS